MCGVCDYLMSTTLGVDMNFVKYLSFIFVCMCVCILTSLYSVCVTLCIMCVCVVYVSVLKGLCLFLRASVLSFSFLTVFCIVIAYLPRLNNHSPHCFEIS